MSRIKQRMNSSTMSDTSSSSSSDSSSDSSMLSSKYTSISAPSIQESSDKIVSDLRNLHLRIKHSNCKRDEQLVESLRDYYDEQVARAKQLERALTRLNNEIAAEERLVDLESNDDDAQVERLRSEYPVAMQVFYDRIIQTSNKRQICRERFEFKKQQMIRENNLNYEEIKKKLENDFKKTIDQLEVKFTTTC